MSLLETLWREEVTLPEHVDALIAEMRASSFVTVKALGLSALKDVATRKPDIFTDFHATYLMRIAFDDDIKPMCDAATETLTAIYQNIQPSDTVVTYLMALQQQCTTPEIPLAKRADFKPWKADRIAELRSALRLQGFAYDQMLWGEKPSATRGPLGAPQRQPRARRRQISASTAECD